jgi:TolA-binding protein
MRGFEVALGLREDFSDAQFRLAGLLYAAADYGRAAQNYRHFSEKHPEDVGAKLQLAAALSRSGSEKEAERVLRALAAQPASRAVATRRLADLVDQLGRKSEARALRDSIDAPKKQLRTLGPSHR